ncbi:MAG: alkaline phosphatase D family protein [Flavobacteriaceae bacterium]|nr:alkaline phosphatase D family protein [Flavobacteriaceae bacterium]
MRTLLLLLVFSITTFISAQTIAFGSCHKVNDPNSDIILTSISDQNPDAFIWLGDIVYGKDGNPKHLSKKFDQLKSKSSYQNLLQSTTVYGTWDDHDYGLNNAGRDYQHKDRSRADLFAFLNVPKDSPAYERNGAYQSYDLSPKIKLILLDNRYFKSEYRPKPYNDPYLPDYEGTILGEQQWDWLENLLKSSTADVHIIASGIQVLSPNHRFEKWQNYPKEYKRLIGLLQTHTVKNPIVLSGDRHMSELSQKDIGYTVLYDATSSGMTEALTNNLNEENPYRVGKSIGVNSYGVLNIDWEKRNINFSFLDIHGKSLFDYNVPLDN